MKTHKADIWKITHYREGRKFDIRWARTYDEAKRIAQEVRDYGDTPIVMAMSTGNQPNE